jgi:hypothetical protein
MAKTKKISSVTLGARVTLSEMLAIQERALKKGLKVSQWLLKVVRAEMERCEICGFPMAFTREEGCVPGDCSRRPTGASPAWHRIQEPGAPRFAKSWNDLSSPENKGDRVRLAEEWMKKGPLPPAGFKGWSEADKLTWLDQNWPLAPPDMAPTSQPQEDW